MKIQANMKRFNVFLVVVCSFVLVSCSFFGEEPAKSSEEPSKIEVVPDSIKQHLIKQDSLYAGLIEKIDTLTNELNESRVTVAQLQQSVDELESPRRIWNYLSIGAIILGLIAIILQFVRSGGLDKNEINTIFRENMDSSTRLKAMKEKLDNLEKNSRNSQNSRYMPTGPVSRKAEDRIAWLEGKIQEVIVAVNRHETEIKRNGGTTTTTPPTGPAKPKEPEFNKDGYAKLNTSIYFMDILDSNQEACVFHINFKSANKGEFDIISLDKIKSRNGWQDVIDATGNCTMEDATSYTVVEKGICEKISDDNTWEVKRKLRIKISK